MSERKEPGLDPVALESLVVDDPARPSGRLTRSVSVEDVGNRGGGVLLTVILLLLVAGGGYLGYTLMQQQERLAGIQLELQQAQARVESLEVLMEVTSDSAAQSGQTLQQRLQGVDTRMTERFTHFDSEIAKLWTIAYQRNKPQLEKQAEQLQKLKLQLGETETAVADVRKDAGKAVAELSQLAVLKSGQVALEKTVQTRLTGVEQQLGTLEQGLKQESEGRLKIQQELTQQLSSLDSGSDASAELAQRIRQNEQAIKAIDGTRRQLSQDLLRIRQQLNNLQLRLEQG